MFIVNTEMSEIASVLHRYTFEGTMSSWSEVRANVLLQRLPCNALGTVVLVE